MNYLRNLGLVLIVLAVPVVLAAANLSPNGGEESGDGQRFVPGELLVLLEEGHAVGAAASIRASVGAQRVRTLYGSMVEKWRVEIGKEEETVASLSTRPGVIWAEPNGIYHALATVPNDPSFGSQWAHSHVNSTSAWDISTGDDTVTIAILDSGVDTGHPDLAAKLVAGYDFVDGDANPIDANGHGTHVAGIAAAVTNNATGVAGMSWGARIMPIRVLDEQGSGTYENITDGINWARMHGAHVLNLSLGGSDYSQAGQDAVNAAHNAGILVVAAMGNFRSSSPFYPAAFDNVMAVGATADDGLVADYSNYGAHCDISAPGGEMDYYHDPGGILSTMPTYACTLTTSYGYSNNYDRQQGTSQAAPLVAGVAALILSEDPSLTPDEVQQLMEQSAMDAGPTGWDQDYGWGVINAVSAIEAVDQIFSDGFESGDTSAWRFSVGAEN